MLKVLFVTRPTIYSGPGGDTIQLIKTAEYLGKLNIEVEISDSTVPDLDGYDLVHFFNLRNPQDILRNVRRTKEKGLPSVLSTIWGSYYECDLKARSGLQLIFTKALGEYRLEYMKVLARALFNSNISINMIPYFLKGHLSSQKEIVRSVDFLLPNSPTEGERVKYDMDFPNANYAWVANAVDLEVFDFDKVRVPDEIRRYEGCLLSAARIEIRKCQLDLIRAINGTPFQLVLVGKPSPNAINYYEQCKKEAGSNVEFLPHVSQDELAALYKVAKAHALVSWMETPGLSSIEAAAMKCNVIVTNRGDTEFYFEEEAIYVEPGDVESIREGILKAMSSQYSEVLHESVKAKFNWQITARQTADAYNVVLGQR